MVQSKRDRSLDETVKLERVLFDKERVKFWAMVVALLGSVYASTMSTIVNGSGAKEESVQELVRQINEVVLPGIHRELEILREDNIKIRERLATMEIYRDLIRDMQKEFRLPVTGGKGKENREAQEEAAKKLLPPEVLFQKMELPRLNIGTYATDYKITGPAQKDTGY